MLRFAAGGLAHVAGAGGGEDGGGDAVDAAGGVYCGAEVGECLLGRCGQWARTHHGRGRSHGAVVEPRRAGPQRRRVVVCVAKIPRTIHIGSGARGVDVDSKAEVGARSQHSGDGSAA